MFMKVAIPVFFVACASVAVALKASDRVEEEEAAVASANTETSSFRPEAPGPRAAVLRKGELDHFWADTKINGRHVRLMVDTGASMVALTRDDARRLGFDKDELDYKYEIRTAGGVTYGAFVMLDEITIGNVEIEDVEAMVLQSDLENSLLGITFLDKLGSYEVRRNSMIIRE